MEDAKYLLPIVATACHSGVFLGSLYLSAEFDRWSAESQRGPPPYGEVQVRGLDRLGGCEREVLVHVHKRQGNRRGAWAGCSRTGLLSVSS